MNELEAAEGARKATRRHRLLALLVGLPASLLLVVPWRVGYRWAFSWDLAEGSTMPLMALGVSGLLFVVAAFVTEERRRRLLVLAGAGAAVSGLWILGALPVRGAYELRDISLLGARTWAVLVMVAAGAEMAMHRQPRSRPIAFFALFGWLGILAAFFFLPVGPHFEPRETVAHGLAQLLDDRHTGQELMIPPCTWFAIVALLGTLQSARRVGADRDLAAERRFRSSWLAGALFPVPMLLLFGLGLFLAGSHETELIPNIIMGFGTLFAPLFGGALALRAALEPPGRPIAWRVPRPVLLGTGAILATTLVVLGLWRSFGTDSADAAIEELAWDLADAVEAGVRGEPFDQRFLGGYSELDLRAAEGVVALPAEARPALVALGGSLGWGDYGGAWAIVRPGEGVRWVERSVGQAAWELVAPESTLERAGPGFAAIVERLGEDGCLPALDEEALGDPVVSVLFPRRPSVAAVCRQSQGGEERGGPRLRTLAGDSVSGQGGAVDRYVVVFAVEGADPIAVGGRLYVHTGRAWIGAPTPWPPEEGTDEP